MLPDAGVIVIELLVPSLATPLLDVQLVVVKSPFCRNVQPVEGYGQDIFSLLPVNPKVI